MWATKLSRNAPCPCRSGKKFKACCYGQRTPPANPGGAGWRGPGVLGRLIAAPGPRLKASQVCPVSCRPVCFGAGAESGGERVLTVSIPVPGGETIDLAWPRSDEWDAKYGAELERLQRDDGSATAREWCLVRLFMDSRAGRPVSLAYLQPRHWVEVYDLRVGEPLRMGLRKAGIQGEARVVGIDPVPGRPGRDEPWGHLLLSERGHGRKPIRDVQLGDEAVTYTPEELGGERPAGCRCEALAKCRVFLVLHKPGGGSVKVGLLRDEEWVRASGACPGRRVWLDMPEMGVRGWAVVQKVEPCTVFRWAGRALVTGTFAHSDGLPGDLVLRGEPVPIRVTPSHLIWSVDRAEWVQVVELRPGEAVKTLAGTTTVESYRMCKEPEPGYNLEVEGDHCYRVGQQGMLVHNTSQPTPGGTPVTCIPGTPGGTPSTPPSGNTNPPPPTPHFTAAQLQQIVTATGTGTALTTGGAAGGAMIRLVASRGLNQINTAAQILEGRDFIHWFFGPTSWRLDRITGNTGGAILFQGQPATATFPSPILAVRSDGGLFRGDTRHLVPTSTGTSFDFAYNQRPNVPQLLKIKVFQGGNWVDAP